MTDPIVTLDEAAALDEARAGGKAANCARLKQAGFPVPDGLVVPADIDDRQIARLGSHAWFDRLPADTRFAVRSSGIGEDSAGQSFAGIHETRLNVARADLVNAVHGCRQSASSEQALAYRRAKQLPTDSIQIGVLLQVMIQPVAAGVAFTVNPITGNDGEIVINSSWGLGDALVSGQVDPDEFGVRKADQSLLWSNLGEKGDTGETSASLTPEQIRELSVLLTRIEQHYGSPQDVEWCYDAVRFWIVQSRPVTTTVREPGETEWTRANLAEVLPELTSPQALDAFEHLLNRAERQYMGGLMAPEEQLGSMVKPFYGRLYFNLSQLRHVCAIAGMPPAMMLKSFGHAAGIQPSDDKPGPATIGERLAAMPTMFRLVSRHLRVERIIRQHAERTQAALARLTETDPESLSDQDLWAAIERWFREAPDYMQTVLLLGGVLMHELPVRRLCERVGFSFEQLAYPQLAIGERSVSAQQAYDLRALADVAREDSKVVAVLTRGPLDWPVVRPALGGTVFLSQFDRFLANYGHRGRYESDWALPRYAEDPLPLLQAIRSHLADGARVDRGKDAVTLEQEARAAWAAFERRLTWWQKRTALPSARRALKKVKQYYVWRERVRSDLVHVLAALRTSHLVLANRFASRGWLERPEQYFFLLLDEIGPVIHGQANGSALRTKVAQRVADLERYRRIAMPLLMHESELPALIRTARLAGAPPEGGDLTGQPVSNGCVEAEVVVVRDPGDFGRMKAGAILVARATDPSWTPLFTLASGVIVEVGGVLSHASTIAREYGLPALANVKSATKVLKTGERVTLDATAGVVRRHRDASS